MFFKKLILVACFFFIHFNAHSNEKIAFINIEYLFENTNLGKSVLNNLQTIKSKNLELIKIKENKLIDEENDIKKTQNVISKEELDKKVSIFKENFRIYNKEKDEILNKFKKTEKSELKNFFDKINPILEEYMNKESINLLFEKKNIFIGRSSNDITGVVLEIINKELK
jgi:Skp family chaperone for outer membrane proteins